MRFPAALLLAAAVASAQFKSTVPLVVAPTTITDAKGHFVDGLEPRDLILYDNNVPQTIQLDYEVYPISVVLAIQASSNAESMLDKLGRLGSMLSQLVAGDAGHTAVITFANQVHTRQDFTSNPDELKKALVALRPEGPNAVTLDAVMEALHMLRSQPANRRRIILMVAEKRVRTSTISMQSVIEEAQRQNALIYWLTFSPSLTTFTQKPNKTDCDKWGKNCTAAPPSNNGSFNVIAGLAELYHLSKPEASELFSKATGARTMNFLTRGGVEDAVQAVGAEIHRQYIVTYQPPAAEPGTFHPIRIEVKERPDLQVRTRAGYWTVQ